MKQFQENGGGAEQTTQKPKVSNELNLSFLCALIVVDK